MFTALLFVIEKHWQQPKCPPKENYMQYIKYYIAVKRKKLMT
jgi:hypothetical protein